MELILIYKNSNNQKVIKINIYAPHLYKYSSVSLYFL